MVAARVNYGPFAAGYVVCKFIDERDLPQRGDVVDYVAVEDKQVKFVAEIAARRRRAAQAFVVVAYVVYLQPVACVRRAESVCSAISLPAAR